MGEAAGSRQPRSEKDKIKRVSGFSPRKLTPETLKDRESSPARPQDARLWDPSLPHIRINQFTSVRLSIYRYIGIRKKKVSEVTLRCDLEHHFPLRSPNSLVPVVRICMAGASIKSAQRGSAPDQVTIELNRRQREIMRRRNCVGCYCKPPPTIASRGAFDKRRLPGPGPRARRPGGARGA